MDTAVVLWWIIVSSGFVVGALQIYGLYEFVSSKSSLLLQKGYPKLILTQSIMVIAYLLFILPLQINYYFPALGTSSFVKLVLFLLAPPVIHFNALIETTRLWLISYNLHYLKASKNEKWKSLIDQNIINKNWYIRSKNTFGNQKKIAIVAMIYWFFVSVIVDIAYYIDWGLYGALINSFFFLLAMIPPYIMYYQCRNYEQLNDNLLFLYKLKATTYVWTIGLILYLIAEGIRMFLGFDFGPSVMYGYLSIFVLATPSLVSTLWIPYKLKLQLENETDIKSMEFSISNSSESGNKSKLFETLKNEQQFEAFIQFMFRDFSSEAMLGYIEIVQFKECFVEEMGIEEVDCRYIGSLYEKVPKSSIVYDGKSDKKGVERMEKIAFDLCNKYIRIDSEYEVNISSKLRKKIIAMSDSHWSMDTKDFLCVFDGVLSDLFKFMRQSFERFDIETLDS